MLGPLRVQSQSSFVSGVAGLDIGDSSEASIEGLGGGEGVGIGVDAGVGGGDTSGALTKPTKPGGRGGVAVEELKVAGGGAGGAEGGVGVTVDPNKR